MLFQIHIGLLLDESVAEATPRHDRLNGRVEGRWNASTQRPQRAELEAGFAVSETQMQHTAPPDSPHVVCIHCCDDGCIIFFKQI